MWVFTKCGFLAIVQHNSMPDHFQVKSRTIEPLEILWPEHEIEIIDWADYRFRITMAKDCLLYTSPSPRDRTRSRMPSSA